MNPDGDASTRPAASISSRRLRLVSVRNCLFFRFGLLALIAVALFALGYLQFGVRPVVLRIADSQFDVAARQVDSSLEQLFNPAENLIAIASEWAISPGFAVDRPDEFNGYFLPILSRMPQFTSVVAGTSDGEGWLLLQLPDGHWLNRLTNIPLRGQEQLLYRWQEGAEPLLERKNIDYDPRSRPWFKGALASPEEGHLHWTPPYPFFTTGEPGITVSTRRDNPDGRTIVVGFDIKLLDISRTTSRVKIGQEGYVLVMTGDGQVLGLPRISETLESAKFILRPVENLGVSPILAGVQAWRETGLGHGKTLRIEVTGRTWLATFRPFVLGEQTFWMALFAPESDFTPPLQPMMRAIIAIALIVLGLTLLLARRQAYQISAPLESLVADSERITQLDFGERPPFHTRYKEFFQLVKTQESMRAMLQKFRLTVEAQALNLQHALDEKQAILDNALIGIFLVKDRRILQHNGRAAELLGYMGEGLTDLGTELLFPDREAYETTGRRIFEVLQRGENFVEELWLQRRDGSQIWGHLSGRAIDSNNPMAGSVWIIADLTEQKDAQDRLHFLGYHDSLTGLPNRHLLSDRLEHAILRAARKKEKLALILIDLDNLKTVNDTLGHQVGDHILIASAQMLKTLLRSADTLARMGGDEFMILIEGLPASDKVVDIAKKLLEAFVAPLDINERQVFMTCSLGITVYPNDGTDCKTLLRNADAAMYQAKAQGRNTYHFYSREMTLHALARLEVEESLRQALKSGGLELHFQPQVSLVDGTIVGAEALVRLRHPQKGLIPPLDFIPVAEDTGLIFPLGRWVMEESCRTWIALARQGYRLPRIAVNVSAKQLQRHDFLDNVKSMLADFGLPPETLELEVTESAFLESEGASELLCALGALGVTLAVDDFGTGYSSLSYLKRLPFRKLKIDKSFVSEIGQAEDGETLVRTIISLAGSLGLEVIAEGVETQEQAKFLQQAGCQVAQGYLYSRPLPAEEFVRLLIKEGRLTAN